MSRQNRHNRRYLHKNATNFFVLTTKWAEGWPWRNSPAFPPRSNGAVFHVYIVADPTDGTRVSWHADAIMPREGASNGPGWL